MKRENMNILKKVVSGIESFTSESFDCKETAVVEAIFRLVKNHPQELSEHLDSIFSEEIESVCMEMVDEGVLEMSVDAEGCIVYSKKE